MLPDRDRTSPSKLFSSPTFSESAPALLRPDVGLPILLLFRAFDPGRRDLIVMFGWSGDGGNGSGGEVDPRDARLGCRPEFRPVDRFPPIEDPYKLAVGRGKHVGVEGRDMDVGMELTVDAVVLVLVLPSDKRDCGLRIAVGITL